MLFAAVYTPRSPSEESEKRGLKLFASWTPPFEFKAHYSLATGGGIAIFEADSAAQVIEGTSPWIPFFEFEVTPVLPVEEGVPIAMKVMEWRDSVS